MKKRIGLYYPQSSMDSVPCLMNTVTLLGKNGYDIDVFTHSDIHHTQPVFHDKHIHLVFLDADVRSSPSCSLAKIIHSLSKNGKKQDTSLFFRVLRFLNRRYYSVKRRLLPLSLALSHELSPYSGFIFVDPWGLADAESVIKHVNIPIIYFSLELIFSDEIVDDATKELKRREQELSQRIALAIIQDDDRAALLSQENGIPLEKIVTVPNGPLGPARRIQSRYWHNRFDLPADTKIVLHTGSLGRWTGLDQIVESVPQWPENWVLVIHTRYAVNTFSLDDPNVQFVNRIKENATLTRKVYISHTPVCSEEYDQLIHGADVGIGLYFIDNQKALEGKNLETLGLSSGKIAYYLKAGLPVITNLRSGLGQLITENRCGISIDAPDMIAQSIFDISHSYNEYSTNAQNLFNEKFDFEKGFTEVLSRFNSL